MTTPACPVCGANHIACGAAPWSGIPVDIPPTARRTTVADLHLYEVPVRGHTTVMKLSAEDAKELYGDAAKKVGPAKPAEPVPVARPPWDTGEVRDPADDSSTEAGVSEKKASAKNKAREA